MQFTEIRKVKEHKRCSYFLFEPEKGTREAHVLLQSASCASITDAWTDIMKRLDSLEEELNLPADSRFVLRVFLSDALNQEIILRNNFPEYFSMPNRVWISFVQQPPLPESKIAVWVYYVDGESSVQTTGFGNVFSSNGLKHIWMANLAGDESLDTFGQTEGMFAKYIKNLARFHANLFNHAIRTWIFVRDVDIMYDDMVKARKLIFEEHGLTENTHYIASTGIEGRNEFPAQYVFMDAYSIAGIDPAQIKFLHAPVHLSRTNIYGVTFERGTEVIYGDRKHVFISGTASIDKNGRILFPGDVEKQTERTIENMEVLLKEARCSLSDLAQVVVYIRDIADYSAVCKKVNELLPSAPFLVLLASVCRPGWLVEMEGIAIKKEKTEWKDF
jgi:enamine deaminase RidA (YjgF/YER057c/UK114 family)